MLDISYADETITIDGADRNFTVAYDKTGTSKQINTFLMNTKFARSIAFALLLLPKQTTEQSLSPALPKRHLLVAFSRLRRRL